MQRRRYLKKQSLEEAQQIFLRHITKKYDKTEILTTQDTLGRITAEPIFAKVSSPHYHCSAMDGVAVNAEDTFKASTALPIRLGKGQFTIVDTGDPIPAEFNAVIMIENVVEIDSETIEITSPAIPWEHVRMAGEDIVATELILTRGHKIRPIDIAGVLSGGITSIKVMKKPVVAIIPTGDEIIEPCESPEQGKIIDSNSYMLSAMVTEWGGNPKRWSIVEDDYEKIKSVVLKASEECDIVLTSAGSSAGREDFIPPAIEEIGKLLVHGISISPGKPTALGIINETPILGLPGYPVSMAVAGECFLKPLLFKMLNISAPIPQKIKASVSRKIASKLGDEEFIRVKLMPKKDKNSDFNIIPLSRGASILNSLIRADGILRVSANTEGLMPNEHVNIELMKTIDEIENSIVIIGSHDITLDILADEIKAKYPHINISSAHVGSLGGLTALKRHEAHVAGTHLLDEDTSEYNIPYIKRLLPDENIILINLAYRQQGLIVKKGNPKGIKNLSDLVNKDITFCNRQRGSGTRILLDYELKKLGLVSDDILGYDREVYTHMAVASAVDTNIADVGLGIYASAKALNLDFIPITEERYDLAIPKKFLSLSNISIMLEIMRSEEFHRRVKALGGYDIRDTGKIILGRVI
ncbi:TPA: molybdopterin biosynthesis protein [bacterium]|nr:molybdopterin biosynthesis protein [bacterium]